MKQSTNCKNCNKEFIVKHESRGHEQLYCSTKCRQKASYERMKRFMQEGQNEIKSIITNNVQIEEEIKTIEDIIDQEKRSGINRFIILVYGIK